MLQGNMGFYYSMYFVGLAIMIVFSLKLYKKIGLLKPMAIGISLLSFFYGIIGAMIAGKIYTAVARLMGSPDSSRVAIYGALIFTPIFVAITAKLIGADLKKLLDIIAPGGLVTLLCAKFGCFMYGCCAGVECSWGVYNKKYEATLFPVQLFEVITMLVLLVLLFVYIYKNKTPGSTYFVMSGSYSFTRFFWEFFRYYDNSRFNNIIFGLSFWQLVSILVFTISLSILFVLKYRQKKLSVI